MSTRLQQSYNASNTNKQPRKTKVDTGIVVDVILNDEHDRILPIDGDSSFFSEKNTTIIGSVVVRPYSNSTTSESSLLTYQPLDSSNLEVPLIGETVELYNIGSVRYYRRLPSLNINTGTATVDKNKTLFDKVDSTKSNKSYSVISQTGTANSSNSEERNTKLGEYFEPQQVNKLKLYEGDKIIQSRFGQSIRFSAYNNSENTFSPSIILRNRQNNESLNNLKPGDLTEEDINKDGSIIAITSQDYKIPFQPGLVDDGGSSNFKTTPIKFETPSEYVGQDQILINSERIILSSKAAEMMFFSKGNYGFISDGKFTIDNGQGGADLDFGGDVNITANRNDSIFYVNTGKGQLRLNTRDNGESPGTNQVEPLVRGESLVILLDKLLTAISNQLFATPSGATDKGPLNKPEFEQIRAELDSIKSTLNFTE